VAQLRDYNSQHAEEAPLTLDKRLYVRVCFGDRKCVEEPTDLRRARFNESLFERSVFVSTQLTDVYFRRCIFQWCDFRYINALRASFQECLFEDCDFYRAYFDANNVLTNAAFRRVSLDKAWLVGVTGLRYEQLTHKLVQECDDETYIVFLNETEGDSPEADPRSRAVADKDIEVASVYRALSGMWTEQGQLADAGRAYVRCKELERKYYRPKRIRERNRRRDTERRQKSDVEENESLARQGWRWLGLLAARVLANYGESMWVVGLWLLALILIPAIGFSIFGGVKWETCPDERLGACDDEVRSLWSTTKYSMERLTDSVSNMHTPHDGAAIVGSIQVFFGIALLGLLGFTIANRLRNT
jgi:hypothetical protein